MRDVSTTDAGMSPGSEAEPAVGVVPDAGRGSLPFALLHGDPLVVIASWALDRAGIEVLDFTTTWADLQQREQPVVVHDPLCPLTPAGFLRAAVREAVASGQVVAGVRPVTDTIKSVSSGRVGETVDRATLVTVTSPVVLPVPVLAALDDWPDLDDLAALVTGLRERFEVRLLEAPALGIRVEDESAVRLLEASAPPADG